MGRAVRLEAVEQQRAEIAHLQGEIQQEINTVEQARHEMRDTVKALTEQLKESEALRLAQTALIEAHEQQIRVIMAHLQAAQRVLQAIQRGRLYRLLRRLGRWGWVEQVLSQSSVEVSSHPQPGNIEPATLQSVEPELLAGLLSERYAGDHDLFSLWESHGFHITPVHFYSPIPKVSTLSEEMWAGSSELVGIELNEHTQLAFLEQICPRFKAEYDTFPHDPTDIPYQYYFNQPMFRAVDAEVLYCMIRHYRPRRIIEVGSGYSTYVGAAAVRKNAEEGYPAELIAIEPYPNEVLRQGFPGLSQLRPEPVQQVDPALFTTLEENDILFIDSSHVLRIDGDVRFLFLEVLPRLSPGVLVHFHDIFLPHDYPREWIVKEHWFWTEQYLLQAFLAFNHAFEVLWAGSYMHIHHNDRLKKVFSNYDPATVWPGSFWLRRLSV